MERRVLPTYLATGFMLNAIVLLAPAGVVRGVAYQTLIWACALSVGVGVRRHRPLDPAAWWLLAAGVGAFGISTLDPRAWSAAPVAVSGLSGLFALAGYPLIATGSLRFARAQSGGRDRGPALDSLLVTLTLTTAIWEVAFTREAAVAADPAFLPSVLLMSAGASWVAGMTVRVLVSGAYRVWAGWALVGSSIAGCAGTTFLALSWQPGGVPGGVTLALWMIALVLMGAAALHPSMPRMTEPSDVETAHTISRVVLPALALLVPPVAMLSRQLTGGGGTNTVAAYSALLIGIVVVLRFANLVSERESAHRALRHRSVHDPLTDLPNRVLLQQRLMESLQARGRDGGQVEVCFVDLDRFKAINDRHGHAAGDQTLITVSARLRAACRPEATVARFAGDEFVVVDPHIDHEGLLVLTDRLRCAASMPIPLADGSEVQVDASVGAVLADADADVDEVLTAADSAMYVVKRQHQSSRLDCAQDDVVPVVGTR